MYDIYYMMYTKKIHNSLLLVNTYTHYKANAGGYSIYHTLQKVIILTTDLHAICLVHDYIRHTLERDELPRLHC